MAFPSILLTTKDALTRHMQWRITLQFAITTQQPLGATQLEEIRHDDRCPIGRWLASEATLAIQPHREFQALVERHREFHRAMEGIAELIGAGDFAEAERAIGPESKFQQVSHDLAMAIMGVEPLLAGSPR